MTDKKLGEFARVMVEHSTDIQEGDNVYLLAKSLDSLPLFEEVRRQIIEKGAYPHEHFFYDSQVGSEGMDYDWMKYASEKQLEHVSEAKKQEMEKMDAYIRIGGPDNTQELSDIKSDKISTRQEATKEIFYERDEKRWVTTRWPTDGLAQSSGMSTQELREYIFDAVTEVDYREIKERNEKIKERLDDASEVRIVAEGTDLSLNIEGRKGVNCHGIRNMPDGEVFYAPRKNSVEGEIEFAFPGVESGNEVRGIWLKFRDGKVVDFSAETNEDFLRDMLDTDEGSRYIGELGIGTNPQMQRFVGNSLLDEKIHGTVHLALGRAYRRSLPDGEERNESGIHWDLVEDLRDGGKIIVDGEVIQESGEWSF
ncbi:MAG: aminopeptidase [Candidatus Nanosalina sp.]